MKNFLKTCIYKAKSLFHLFTQTKKGGGLAIKQSTTDQINNKTETTLKRFKKWWK